MMGTVDLSETQGQADPARMRASDADRDRIADRLREALAEGRLTAEEHAERIDAVYRAKTYAELTPIVADLPDPAGTPAVLRDDLPAPRPVSPTIVAIVSGAERRGRWLVDPELTVVTVMGGVELDLRQAVLSRREVTINVTNILGGVSVTVPPGVRVIDSVASVLGGCTVPPDDAVAADAPVIRLTGMVLLGGIDVRRRTADDDALDSAGISRRRRDIHRELRHRQRAVHRDFREQRRELRRTRRHGG